MSAITSLADLFVAVSEQAKQADFAHLFPRFVAMTENRISEALRLEDQSTTVTLTADAQGRIALPADFREIRSIRPTAIGFSPLPGGALDVLNAIYPSSGPPAAYAIGGGYLHLRPKGAAEVDLTYWAGIPRLTAANPTNAMLTRYPNCYLWGCVTEVMLWAVNKDGSDLAEGEFNKAIERATVDNERRLFSTVRTMRTGVTP